MQNGSNDLTMPTVEEVPKQLTLGQKLVGLNFNPSNDDAVGSVKQLFADAADILNNIYQQNERSELSTLLYNHAIGEILNAQMNVVKVITLKY